MKMLRCAVVALLATCASVATGDNRAAAWDYEEPGFNVIHIQAVVNAILYDDTWPSGGAFDYSGDGLLNVLDVQVMVNHVLNIQTEPLILPFWSIGELGIPYEANMGVLRPSPSTPPLTWTIESGSLPPGLSMTAGGVVSGTPTASGLFTAQIQIHTPAPGHSRTVTWEIVE